MTYQRLRMVADLPRFENPVLVYGFTGFLEAGAAVRTATEHLLENLEHTDIAEFSIDDIYDYRARRPRMRFSSDHYEGLELPHLRIAACRDERGAGFFILHGVEPDFAWQSVMDDIAAFIREAGIVLSVSILAVPFPAPHTRPVAVTAHANDSSLIEGRTSWVGDMEVPASLVGALEYRLGLEGLPAMGFAAHVPHYLAAVGHPASALALVREVAIATGLLLPTDALREASEVSDNELAEQLQANPENLDGIRQLEGQYDALLAERASAADGEPSAVDAIADQVEAFLAQMESRGKTDD